MSGNDKRPPTNLRRLRQQADRKFLLLVLATLVLIGGSLIALFYDLGGLLAALPCLLGGAGAILLIYLLFGVIDWLLDRYY